MPVGLEAVLFVVLGVAAGLGFYYLVTSMVEYAIDTLLESCFVAACNDLFGEMTVR